MNADFKINSNTDSNFIDSHSIQNDGIDGSEKNIENVKNLFQVAQNEQTASAQDKITDLSQRTVKSADGLSSKQEWALASIRWALVAIAVASIAMLILMFILLFLPATLATLPAIPLTLMSFSPLLLTSSLTGLVLERVCKAVCKARTKPLEKYNGQNVKNENIILVLKAKKDPNWALKFMHPETLSILKNQEKYQTVYRTVESIHEMSKAIDEMVAQGNHIHGLWIKAHGNSQLIKLGDVKPRGELDPESTEYQTFMSNAYPCWEKSIKKLQPAFSKLEKDAAVILDVCSNGAVREVGDPKEKIVCEKSIAQTIASLNPNVRVFASTKLVHALGCTIESLEPNIQVKFNDANSVLDMVLFGRHSTSGSNTVCFKEYPKKITPIDVEVEVS